MGIRDSFQEIEVVTSLRGRDQKMNLLWEEWMSDKRTDVATHNGCRDNKKSPQELKASRDQIKASTTYAETTNVATKNRGRDINNQMG